MPAIRQTAKRPKQITPQLTVIEDAAFDAWRAQHFPGASRSAVVSELMRARISAEPNSEEALHTAGARIAYLSVLTEMRAGLGAKLRELSIDFGIRRDATPDSAVFLSRGTTP